MATTLPGNRKSSRAALLALLLAMAGAAAMVYYHLDLFMPRVRAVASAKNLAGGYSFGNDFYPVWITSREWLRARRDPYSVEMTREIQVGLFGRPLEASIPTDPPPDYRTFAYPAFTDLLFWPAAEFSFFSVRVAVVVGLAVLTAVSILLWMRALAWHIDWKWIAVAILLTLGSYPVLEGLYASQLGLLVGFFLAASMLALRRGRLLLAGILMALTAIKPQMTLLAAIYLVAWSIQRWQERWRFCAGLFSTIALLTATALAVWPHWIASWTHVILGYHRYAKPPLVREVLAEPLGASVAGMVTVLMTAALLIATMLLAWRNRAAAGSSLGFWLTLSILLGVTAISMLPGQALHDHVILLPGIFLLAAKRNEWSASSIFKILMAIGVVALLWPWIAAISLIAIRSFLTEQQFYSRVVFALPLRTAAAFPFVVLGLLVVAFRRVTAEPAPR